MAQGKLARFKARNTALRTENKELREGIETIESSHNPSVLRQFIGIGIKDGTAYGGSRLFTKGQQKGWMPAALAVDGIVGATAQIGAAFFDGPVASVVRDIGDGLTCGALGRMGALHQMTTSEVAGNVCYWRPTAPAKANNNNNNNNNANGGG